ncbi:hypothetical protein NQ314_010653 [Rhamnusium bicolor]|uniref:Uncharacterized protein n=1 Tax=Rhamnusium bicolor TaxID=1586634 RepID=A0AAV8XPW6_9CUCU|nr:hypothetical protein NQ314_010653 [Rhamnusium bicolor]
MKGLHCGKTMDGSASETESQHSENNVVEVSASEVSTEQQTEEIYDSTSEKILRNFIEDYESLHLIFV